ncbi:MAG: hypothetical protein AB7K71_26455 [Polyangiaceae bacterium]
MGYDDFHRARDAVSGPHIKLGGPYQRETSRNLKAGLTEQPHRRLSSRTLGALPRGTEA